MTSFADINWLAWQLPEREAADACSLKVIARRMMADSDINLVHGAIRELERRVAALEAKQQPAAIVPHVWTHPSPITIKGNGWTYTPCSGPTLND